MNCVALRRDLRARLCVVLGTTVDRVQIEGLRVAAGTVDLAVLGTAGSDAIVLLLLDAQHYGILIAQIFFGLWLVPLGYLAYKSAGMFPKWLAVLRSRWSCTCS